jgi:hypothetical protein
MQEQHNVRRYYQVPEQANWYWMQEQHNVRRYYQVPEQGINHLHQIGSGSFFMLSLVPAGDILSEIQPTLNI